MIDYDKKIQVAMEKTQVIRPPKQDLSTFGSTSIRYYLVTEPSYHELEGLTDRREESVVREGRVVAERPKIVTPAYLATMFEGFEHGKQYAEYIMRRYGPSEPGLLYRYRNEGSNVTIVSGSVEEVVARLNQTLDRDYDNLAAIVRGVDEMWDVSLMKLVHDVARQSLRANVADMYQRGLLSMDKRGLPRDARVAIEELFLKVDRGEIEPRVLKAELDAWNVFEEYEDRFLGLFRRC